MNKRDLLEEELWGRCEREGKGVHEVIKRFGLASRNCSPPYICAAVRERENLDRLRHDDVFSAYVTANWRSKRLLDDALALRYSNVELRAMTRLEKIQSIYLCTLALEFEDTAANKVRRDNWVAASFPLVRTDVTVAARMCVDYLKGVFVAGQYLCPS